MLAIVASSTTISWAMQISTRAQPRCCSSALGGVDLRLGSLDGFGQFGHGFPYCR